MNLRLGESVASVSIAGMHLQQSVIEIPFRTFCDAETFEHIQRLMSQARFIAGGYFMEHPWKSLLGSAFLDPAYWAAVKEASLVGVRAA